MAGGMMDCPGNNARSATVILDFSDILAGNIYQGMNPVMKTQLKKLSLVPAIAVIGLGIPSVACAESTASASSSSSHGPTRSVRTYNPGPGYAYSYSNSAPVGPRSNYYYPSPYYYPADSQRYRGKSKHRTDSRSSWSGKNRHGQKSNVMSNMFSNMFSDGDGELKLDMDMKMKFN
jgi:hypothetical protein